MTSDERLERIELLLTAMVALQVADREDDGAPRRSELVLAEAGLSLNEIARLTGKKYETVKSTLRRSKPGGRE